MKIKIIVINICLVVFILCLSANSGLAGKNESVIVYLKDGKEIRGEILQLQNRFIKIDPEGAISLRTIQGADIDKIEWIATGELLTFPIDESRIPGDLSEDPLVRRSRRSNGLRPIGLTASVGQSIPSGEYYEGILSGFAFQAGGYYRFSKGDPYGTTFFIGFSYNYSSHGFDEEKIYYAGQYVVFDDCAIHQYNFDFGATTGVSNSDSYLYLLSGLSIVDSRITGHVEDVTGTLRGPQSTYSESHAAFRFHGGGVLGVTANIGIDLRIGFDFLLTESESTYEYDYYNQGPDVMGTIIAFGAGIVWEP